MNTALTTVAPEAVETPLLALLVGKTGAAPGSLVAVDKAAGGALGRAFSSSDFRGDRLETFLVHPSDAAADRLLLVGIGDSGDDTLGAIRLAAAVAARRAVTAGSGGMAIWVEPVTADGQGPEALAQAVIEGVAQGGWRFVSYKSPDEEDRARELTEIVLVVREAHADPAESGRAAGDAIAAGQRAARDLQMQPGNVCTPSYLAEFARTLAEDNDFGLTILDRPALEAEGCRALLAVGQGSAEEPRLIVLEYRGGGDGAPVALVGKGITFDTGGISIKPALNMEEMKFDMSGAAAVLGTFVALAKLRPKVNVVGIVPSAENMPSGTAIKPGDIVESHLGKTIEIVNTDAEGRLVLCDALSYARRFSPACVLDAATLTGAVVIALGHDATGVMGNDDALVDEVIAAGRAAGEPCWSLPLWDVYRELIKSDVADIKNSAGRPASSITAGWFLGEFAEDFKWAHLDIAGTAWTDRDRPERVRGPTGLGVRLFVEFIRQHAVA